MKEKSYCPSPGWGLIICLRKGVRFEVVLRGQTLTIENKRNCMIFQAFTTLFKEGRFQKLIHIEKT